MLSIKLALFCIVFVVAFADRPDPNNVFKPLWDSFSDEQKKEAAEIMKDTSLTKGEIRKKMDDWVANLDEKVKVLNSLFLILIKFNLDCLCDLFTNDGRLQKQAFDCSEYD
jgi:hypothetical protein